MYPVAAQVVVADADCLSEHTDCLSEQLELLMDEADEAEVHGAHAANYVAMCCIAIVAHRTRRTL